MNITYKKQQIPHLQIIADMALNGIKDELIAYLAMATLAEVFAAAEEAENEDTLMDISALEHLKDILEYSVDSLDLKEVKDYIKKYPKSELVSYVLTTQSLPGATPMQKWHHNKKYIMGMMRGALLNNIKYNIDQAVNDFVKIDSAENQVTV